MKICVRSSMVSRCAAIVTVTMLLGAGPAFAGHGFATSAPNKASLADPPPVDVDPAFTYSSASIAAGGASLRNRASSEINLSSLPTDAKVIQAFLYWDFTSLTSITNKQSTVCFGKSQEPNFNQCSNNGGYGRGGDDDYGLSSISKNQSKLHSSDGEGGDGGDGGYPGGGDDQNQQCINVSGSQIGEGADACWAGGSNFAFRADVTKLIKGNGRYLVALQPGAASTESGIDPTDPSSPTVGPYAEGASLVVIFSSSIIPNGQVLVYDSGIAGQEFIAGVGFFYSLLDVPATGSGDSIFTEIGADGQAGEGPLNFEATKITTLNGFAIAGPGSPASDSDWNGSDGNPSIQLWDTHEHDVTGHLVTGANSVSVTDPADAPLGDCVIGIANVLTVR